jgi:hypothetical protein
MRKIFTLLIILISLEAKCPNDERCASCNRERCNVCYDSYLASDGVCNSSRLKIENCLQYENEGVCRFCHHGFFLSKEGTCARIAIENCLELDGDGNCTVCAQGILLKDNKCDPINKCSSENCELCTLRQGAETCVKCQKDFAISSGKGCVLEGENSKNCLFLNQYGECVICEFNHYHHNGLCLKSSLLDMKEPLLTKATETGEAPKTGISGFFDKMLTGIKDFFGYKSVDITSALLLGFITLLY